LSPSQLLDRYLARLLGGRIDPRLLWPAVALMLVPVFLHINYAKLSVSVTALLFPAIVAAAGFIDRRYLVVTGLSGLMLVYANTLPVRTSLAEMASVWMAANVVCEVVYLASRSARRAERAWRQREQSLLLLDEVRNLMDQETKLEPLLQRGVVALRDRLGIQRVSFMQRKGDEMQVRADHGWPPSDKESQMRYGQGVIGRALVTGKTQFVPDVMKDPDFINSLNDTQGSEIATPIVVRGEPWGVLNVESGFSPGTRVLTEDDVAVIERLGRALGLAIERADDLAETAAARDQAVQALKAKALFLSTMSHELRTPLHTIIASTEIVRDDTPDNSHRQLAQMSLDAAHNLTRILGDILDFSRAELGKLKVNINVVDVFASATEVAITMRPSAASKGLALTVGADGEAPIHAMCDSARLRQILLNLVGNAIKFTDTGRVHVQIAREGNMLRTAVIDTGIGLAPEDVPKLFEPFSQVDSTQARNYEGTGLGLAICKQLVVRMGGDIGANGTPGQGSTVWFTLPAAPLPAAPLPAAPLPAAPPTTAPAA
jgi:signal transduction histidine kinase